MRNNFFFNKNLFKLEEDESESDEIDYENSLRKIASNVMLKISSLLELVHTNNGCEPSEYIPFSLEAALLSSASITFDLHDNDMSFSYRMQCFVISWDILLMERKFKTTCLAQILNVR